MAVGCMGGSVVEFSPATQETQVCFLTHAATASSPLWAFLVAQTVKNSPVIQETGVQALG